MSKVRILLKEPYQTGKELEGEQDAVNIAKYIFAASVEVDWADLRNWLNEAYEKRGSLEIFGYPSLEQYLAEQLKEEQK